MSIIVRDKNGSRKKIAGVGLPGPVGKSAYQYAVECGFTGTEAEFAALQGVRSNPNLLDNWYFADPINQRGQAEYTEDGYTIDRWRVYGKGIKVNVLNNCIKLTASETENIYFAQLREHTLGPGVYTVSVLIRNASAGSLLASNDGHTTYYGNKTFNSIGSEWELVSTSFIVPNGNTLKRAYIRIDKGGSAELLSFKLELGPVQTLAHQDTNGNWILNDPPPDKALELAKCQRYQVVQNLGYWNHVAFGSYYNTTSANFIITTPVSLRAHPSVSLIGIFSISGLGKNILNDSSMSDPITYKITDVNSTEVMLQFANLPAINSTDINHILSLTSGASSAKVILDANL